MRDELMSEIIKMCIRDRSIPILSHAKRRK